MLIETHIDHSVFDTAVPVVLDSHRVLLLLLGRNIARID